MPLDETHDAERRSWVESANAAGCEFPIQNLPFGVFSAKDGAPRGGVAIGDRILDVAAFSKALGFSGPAAIAAAACGEATLNRLMSLGIRTGPPLGSLSPAPCRATTAAKIARPKASPAWFPH